MLASWWTRRLPFQVILLLLLLLSSTGVNTKEAPERPGSPVVPGEPVRRSVVLKGESHVEKIEVLTPVTYELQCTWTGTGSKSPNITGFWKRNDGEIENSRVAVPLENNQYNLKREVSIVGDETLGNYSCVFDGAKATIDFIFAVPHMADHDKPVVSYVGDSVVLTCKMEGSKPTPVTWHWYKTNGTDKALINGSLEHRYKITNAEDRKTTRLVVLDVAQRDTGMYYCGAVYEAGTSLSRTELRVISFTEPLKPFVAIVIEVIILVVLILLYERSGKKTTPGDPEDEPNTEQTNQLTQGDNSETSMRQRKV